MTEWIGSFINNVVDLPWPGIAAFYFASGLLEVLLQPWPGTTVLVFGGCITAIAFPQGWLVVMLAFFLGEGLGMFIVYELGARWGEKILALRWVKKLLSTARREQLSGWMQRYGAGMIFAAKFIGGINVMTIFLSGILRIRRRKAFLVISLAALVHCLFFFSIGLLVGGTWEDVLAAIVTYNTRAIWLAVLAVIVLLGIWFVHKRIERSVQDRALRDDAKQEQQGKIAQAGADSRQEPDAPNPPRKGA